MPQNGTVRLPRRPGVPEDRHIATSLGYTPREHDREMYKWRHLVENFFSRIKEFRAIATRFDKTDASFAARIQLVAGVIAAT